MTENNYLHQCPICNASLPHSSRYPNYVCGQCAKKTTDSEGQTVIFANIGIHGGLSGVYASDGRQYKYQECFIGDTKCFASDAHTGGIVIETCDFHEKLITEPVLIKQTFTLVPKNWYAMEIISGEFSPNVRSYSPIKVLDLERKKTGKGLFFLHFYHANYPEGVREKAYSMQMVERAQSFVLAKTTDRSQIRYMLIYSIDEEWLSNHFNVELERAESVKSWLERNT